MPPIHPTLHALQQRTLPKRSLHLIRLTAWLLVPITVVLAWAPLSPYLLIIRTWVLPMALGLCLLGGIGAWCLLRRWLLADASAIAPAKQWRRMVSMLEWALLLFCFTGCAIAASWQVWSFSQAKRSVLEHASESLSLNTLGRHFIISYRDFKEAAVLAERGAIAGIYLRSANVRDKSAFEIRSEVMALQRLRHRNGLPELIIAADQEGGAVEHMSPPLQSRPSLAELLIDLPTSLEDEMAGPTGAHKAAADALLAVYNYGHEQGRELRGLGVNLNLGPIADLSPSADTKVGFDTHTLLSKRALSASPYVVAQATSAYIDGLNSSGIQATLKHFPGLARVTTDTHHFIARLDTPSALLQQSDWLPFQHSMPQAAATMLGHVIIQDLDPNAPASLSPKVVAMLRQDWGYQGLLMTDDINMGALYHRYGICESTVRALNAGVDLVLISYDSDQYYPAMDCALTAMARGELQLRQSPQTHARIARFFTPAAAATAEQEKTLLHAQL